MQEGKVGDDRVQDIGPELAARAHPRIHTSAGTGSSFDVKATARAAAAAAAVATQCPASDTKGQTAPLLVSSDGQNIRFPPVHCAADGSGGRACVESRIIILNDPSRRSELTPSPPDSALEAKLHLKHRPSTIDQSGSSRTLPADTNTVPCAPVLQVPVEAEKRKGREAGRVGERTWLRPRASQLETLPQDGNSPQISS